ncbi:aryl hydrocarbon receptor repressor [Urocitellus parryii]
MIPPGECTYAGRKRRKPAQKQRPALGAEKSNPSKRHRDRLNAELDHLASLLPFPPDVIAKLDKLSVLRLSVSYLRVKSFFQAVQETHVQSAGASSPGDGPHRGSPVQEGRLLLESLNGFALVVSADGMIFYASPTIVDYLGFHQTDVMHQNIYDYIHVEDRHDFCRQLHWAMDPPQGLGQPPRPDTGDDSVLRRLLRAQEGGSGSPTEYSAFLTRCFVCRVRCLLDSTSGFLMMQFQGKLKFLLGQKKKAPSGSILPPRLSLFCTVAPVLLPALAEVKMKGAFLRAKHRVDTSATVDPRAQATAALCGPDPRAKPSFTAGSSHGENCVPLFRSQVDTGHWTRAPSRALCLCLRGGPELILDPTGAAGDGEDAEQERVLSGCAAGRGRRETQAHNCCWETPTPMRHPSWTADKRDKPKPQPTRIERPSMRGVSHVSCMPYPEAQGMLSTSGTTPFRSSPLSPLPGSPHSAYCSRPSRPLRDLQQEQGHPPCHTLQSGLEKRLPVPGAQCFPAGGYSTEDAKLPGLLVSPGAPRSPALLLEVPIKVENDSGSEEAVDICTPSQVWLGASNMAKRQLVTFPTRMHLKTELDCRHQIHTPHLVHGVVGAHPHSQATTETSRELVPFFPSPCACLEPEPPLHLCTPSCPEHQHLARGCDCRAPRAAAVVKREPLDSPPWAAAPGQGAVPRLFPKSTSAFLP